MTRNEIEKKVRAKVEAEVAGLLAEEQRQAERVAMWARKAAASRAARKPFLATLEALKAKATTMWQVLDWDCEGRSSRPAGIFTNLAAAQKAAATSGPMGTPSEPVPSLVWDNEKDYFAFLKAKADMERAGDDAERAAY